MKKKESAINTITNFCKRLVEHEVETKHDLLKQEVDELSNKLEDLIQLDKSMARMGSFMLSSSCKKLTRLKLVYRVVQQLVQALNKLDSVLVRESFKEYLKDRHKNQTLYYIKSQEAGSKLDKQMENASELYRQASKISECREMKENQLLTRLLHEKIFNSHEN